jgi:hypothetical protein
MDLKNLTYEQLKVLNLTDEQIKAILGAAESTSSGNGLPFPLLKINFDADLGKLGVWGYNPIKGDEGVTGYEKIYDPTIKVRFLKSVAQYSKFDTAENRATVTSNIFALKDAKKAYDLKTGVAISQLKEMDDDIKYQRILLGVIIDGEEEKPFIMYAKGAFLYTLNEILRKYPNEGHLTHIFELKTKKKKRGSVTYFEVEAVNVEELSQEDFIKNIKKDAETISEFDKWVESVNNNVSDSETLNKINKQVEEVDEDEDNIKF